jgi:Flp pilus assembly protein TadD
VTFAVAVAGVCVGPGCASFEGARLYTSGTEALDRGEPAVAVDELQRAATLLPEASEVHNHLGLAYQAAGRPGEAESAFRRAVDLDCDNAAAVENLRVAELRAARRAAQENAR